MHAGDPLNLNQVPSPCMHVGTTRLDEADLRRDDLALVHLQDPRRGDVGLAAQEHGPHAPRAVLQQAHVDLHARRCTHTGGNNKTSTAEEDWDRRLSVYNL